MHQLCTTLVNSQLFYIYLRYGCYIVGYKAFYHTLGDMHAVHKLPNKKCQMANENFSRCNTILIGQGSCIF